MKNKIFVILIFLANQFCLFSDMPGPHGHGSAGDGSVLKLIIPLSLFVVVTTCFICFIVISLNKNKKNVDKKV